MINKILNTVSLFFGISKSEVRGMFLLLLTCLVLLLLPVYQKYVYTQEPSAFVIIVDTNTIVSSSTNAYESHFIEAKDSDNNLIENKRTHDVWINEITTEDLKQIGINNRISFNIIKYLEKGGRFRHKEDLKKIYDMDEKSYELIINNTLWESQSIIESKNKKEDVPKTYQNSAKEKFDINTADTVELVKVKGIGSKLALRIIKYRDLLGGFVHINQLHEVYGLSDFAINELTSHALIRENFKPKTIAINHAQLELLSSHPYLGNKKSKVIYNYLKNHSKLSNFEEFQKSYPFTEEELTKIKHYISYE